LNLGGSTVYVALAISPKNKLKDPMMPLSADALKPGTCQHSIVEKPFLAAIAVKFSDGVVWIVNCAADGFEYVERSGSSSDENDRRDFMVILRSGIEKPVRLEKDGKPRIDCMIGKMGLNILRLLE
jgi:hypothetical protein